MHNSMFPKMEELELFCVLRLLVRKLWLIVMAALELTAAKYEADGSPLITKLMR